MGESIILTREMGEYSSTRRAKDELSSSESVDKNEGKGKGKEKVVVDVDVDVKNNSEEKDNKADVIDEATLIGWRPPPPPGFSRKSLTESVFRDCGFLGLPPGWRLEIRPRTSVKYIGKFDQYYYEPGTNEKFRSLKTVLNYLRVTGQPLRAPTQLPNELINTDLYNDPVIMRHFRSVNAVMRHLRATAGQPSHAPPPRAAAAAAAGQQINNEQATSQQNQGTPDQHPTQQGGQPDEVYCKPGSNQQFRSPKAVLRHLQATGKKLEELPRAPAVAGQQAQKQGNEVKPDHQLPVQQGDKYSEVYGKPGTNKPFRSPKAVLRYLQATGKKLEELPRVLVVVGQQIKNEQAQRQGNEVKSDNQLPIQQGDKSEVAESSSRKKPGRKRKPIPSCSEINKFVNPLHAWAPPPAAGNDQSNPIVVEDYIPRKDLWTHTFASADHPNKKTTKAPNSFNG